MSKKKKKMNAKGQQIKERVSTNHAPRIDATKTIYEVDGSVCAYKESECAEEAVVNAGVISEGTSVVNPVTEEVIETIGEETDGNESYEDNEDDINMGEEADDEDSGVSEENAEDDEDFDEVIETLRAKPNEHVAKHNRVEKHYEGATNISGISEWKDLHCILKSTAMVEAANANPNIINTTNYNTDIIDKLHKISKHNYEIYAQYDMHWKQYCFRGQFINWQNDKYNGYFDTTRAMEAQYQKLIDSNIDNGTGIYYCNNIETMTCGCLLTLEHLITMPIRGFAPEVAIYVDMDRYDEFLEKYATKVICCHTSDQVPPHMLKLVSDGMAPSRGIYPYYLINMPELMKLLRNDTPYYNGSTINGIYMHIYGGKDGMSKTVSSAAVEYDTELSLAYTNAILG